jgi:hypothetical protein
MEAHDGWEKLWCRCGTIAAQGLERTTTCDVEAYNSKANTDLYEHEQANGSSLRLCRLQIYLGNREGQFRQRGMVVDLRSSATNN